ncbi:MAG: hypothetical protein A2X59_12350 [Nitrospirae bacterium GWC2_42_7]|nr:MAG: hypothetical protein A2X59_12350 [Nitrospirae bacterium GWC2_42_7]
MKKLVLAALVLLAIFYLPFINKAVHIDDHNFIAMSEAIELPLSYKQGYAYYFTGSMTENYNPYGSSHPPFIPLFLKLLSIIAGGYKEYMLHAGFLIFSFLLVISVLLLSKEVGIPPFPTALFICTNVAILPVGHNLMADMPMLSFWMLAAYLFISGINKDSQRRILSSIFPLTIAGLISYQTFFLLPAFLLPLLAKKKIDIKTLVIFFIPAAVLGSVLLYLTLQYSSPITGIFNEIRMGLQPDRLFNKGLGIPVSIGVSMLFVLPAIYKDMIISRKNIIMAAGAVLIVIPPVVSLSYPLWSSIWLVLLASTGLFSVVFTVQNGFKRIKDSPMVLFMLLWLASVLFYNIFLMPFGALRYIMPVIVPISFLIFWISAKSKRLMLSAILTSLLGLAVAYSDYIYASSYRDFSEVTKQTVGTVRSRVWYIGEWGMHYYMDKQGFRYLVKNKDIPEEGDLIIMADVPRLWSPSLELYSRMKLIDVREIGSWYPIRVMGADINTGYYSYLWGYQPFTLSSLPVERFGIFRVIDPYK